MLQFKQGLGPYLKDGPLQLRVARPSCRLLSSATSEPGTSLRWSWRNDSCARYRTGLWHIITVSVSSSFHPPPKMTTMIPPRDRIRPMFSPPFPSFIFKAINCRLCAEHHGRSVSFKPFSAGCRLRCRRHRREGLPRPQTHHSCPAISGVAVVTRATSLVIIDTTLRISFWTAGSFIPPTSPCHTNHQTLGLYMVLTLPPRHSHHS